MCSLRCIKCSKPGNPERRVEVRVSRGRRQARPEAGAAALAASVLEARRPFLRPRGGTSYARGHRAPGPLVGPPSLTLSPSRPPGLLGPEHPQGGVHAGPAPAAPPPASGRAGGFPAARSGRRRGWHRGACPTAVKGKLDHPSFTKDSCSLPSCPLKE